MQLEDRSECVSDLGFDEWFADEGSPDERARFTAHLQTCTRCRLRGELFDRERAAFLAKAPTLDANADWAQRSRQAKRAQRLRGAPAWLGLSAAAVIGMLVAWIGLPFKPWATTGVTAAPDTGERSKGAAQVGFYIKRGEHVQRGANGDTVYPGDQLRFTYSSVRPMYLALLGRDQRTASVYFPSGAQAARVDSARDRALDFSLELDAQLGDERLFAMLCPNEFALGPLRAELEASGELHAAAECRVERIALRKAAPP
jgi:hypothetical protein